MRRGGDVIGRLFASRTSQVTSSSDNQQFSILLTLILDNITRVFRGSLRSSPAHGGGAVHVVHRKWIYKSFDGLFEYHWETIAISSCPAVLFCDTDWSPLSTPFPIYLDGISSSLSSWYCLPSLRFLTGTIVVSRYKWWLEISLARFSCFDRVVLLRLRFASTRWQDRYNAKKTGRPFAS